LIAALLLLAGVALAQPPGWEGRLAEIAPALRACLEGRPGAMVVDAFGGGARLHVRLRLPGNRREECLVDRRDAVVEERRGLSPGESTPGERLRAFMLERRCVDAVRVVDAAGRELGWLAYPACG
jgi:hypothetical protein